MTESVHAVDAQRAKLLALFCALGLAMFLIDLGAGVWLWHYMGQYKPILPGFSFIGLALFSLCFLLALLLHRSLSRLPGGRSEPLPPDDVDGTWK